MGRILIITGIIILIVGLFICFGGKFSYLGRLPGDIIAKKGTTTFYFPIVSGVVISIILTVLINIILKILR